eukprot:ANDGO_03166.mRNA.1 hypothetical protein NAEGRDRAFT_57266
MASRTCSWSSEPDDGRELLVDPDYDPPLVIVQGTAHASSLSSQFSSSSSSSSATSASNGASLPPSPRSRSQFDAGLNTTIAPIHSLVDDSSHSQSVAVKHSQSNFAGNVVQGNMPGRGGQTSSSAGDDGHVQFASDQSEHGPSLDEPSDDPGSDVHEDGAANRGSLALAPSSSSQLTQHACTQQTPQLGNGPSAKPSSRTPSPPVHLHRERTNPPPKISAAPLFPSDTRSSSPSASPRRHPLRSVSHSSASHQTVSLQPRIFRTIQDALAAANHGDTIRIKAGTYTVPNKIVLIHDVLVIGEGTVKILSPEPCVIESYAESACLSKIEIDSSPEFYAWSQAAVYVREGYLQMEQCAVSARACTGIKISRGAECLLDRCTVSNCSMRGVSAKDSSQLVATKCRFSNNRYSGVAAYNESRIELRQCKILSNGMSGIVASELADIVVENCDLIGNNTLDVDAADVTIRHVSVRAIVEGCRISDSGVQLNDLSDERDFEENTFGVTTTRRCTIT